MFFLLIINYFSAEEFDIDLGIAGTVGGILETFSKSIGAEA